MGHKRVDKAIGELSDRSLMADVTITLRKTLDSAVMTMWAEK
jgi:hypothetical protein